MIERFIQALSVADATNEDLAGTRERLKDRFPRGATRRMTQLGLLIGGVLDDLAPRADDTVVYASAYAESRALEGYLDSFPSASPTLFQTSIHPSAVQQALINRQHPVGEFFPMTGRAQLVAHAVEASLLSPAPRVLLCGGEERGGWLLERNAASAQSFAFGLALTSDPANAIGRLALTPISDGVSAELSLPDFFAAIVARRPIDSPARPGARLTLQWL